MHVALVVILAAVFLLSVIAEIRGRRTRKNMPIEIRPMKRRVTCAKCFRTPARDENLMSWFFVIRHGVPHYFCDRCLPGQAKEKIEEHVVPLLKWCDLAQRSHLN